VVVSLVEIDEERWWASWGLSLILDVAQPDNPLRSNCVRSISNETAQSSTGGVLTTVPSAFHVSKESMNVQCGHVLSQRTCGLRLLSHCQSDQKLAVRKPRRPIQALLEGEPIRVEWPPGTRQGSSGDCFLQPGFRAASKNLFQAYTSLRACHKMMSCTGMRRSLSPELCPAV
jgi:hypothetical protein